MIIVKNLYHTYPGEIKALRNVSLKIEDGEFVCIMGENGAGKTTLVKHFNRLLDPTKGKIIIDEKDISEFSTAALSKKIGIVFQNPNNQLFCETVEKEIEFGPRNFGFSRIEIKKRVDWALKKLNITHFRKNSPFELSEGEKKKIAIASIIAWNPSIIILDEPTIAQDHEQKSILRKLINDFWEEKKTIIMITHDVEFVSEMSPRVILMAKGKIIADDPAENILTNKNLVDKASLVIPQIGQVFVDIPEIKKKIINIKGAKKELTPFLGDLK